MRVEEFALEARSNPEQNPKISPYTTLLRMLGNVEFLESGLKNLFISMTSLEKLGINPKSSYNTPVGIYSYDAEYVVNTLEPKDSFTKLPFAGDKPWINIFSIKPDSNVIDLSTFTDSDATYYYNKFLNNLPNSRFLKSSILKHINELSEQGKYEAKVKEIPGGIFWYVTYKLANLYASSLGNRNRNPAVVWTSIFRRMGIDGFIDTGNGIIHHAEPSQSVFFNFKIINLISRIPNLKGSNDIDNMKIKGNKIRLEYTSLIKKLKQVQNVGELYTWLGEVASVSYTIFDINAKKRLFNKIPDNLRYQLLLVRPDIVTWKDMYDGVKLIDIKAIINSGKFQYLSNLKKDSLKSLISLDMLGDLLANRMKPESLFEPIANVTIMIDNLLFTLTNTYNNDNDIIKLLFKILPYIDIDPILNWIMYDLVPSMVDKNLLKSLLAAMSKKIDVNSHPKKDILSALQRKYES